MPSCEKGFCEGVEALGELLDMLIFGLVSSSCGGGVVEAFGELDMLIFGLGCSFPCGPKAS